MTPYIDWNSPTRICPGCKVDLPLSSFYPNPRRKNGRSSKCRRCQRAVATQSYKRHAVRRVKRKPVQIAPRLTQKERVMQAIEDGARTQEEIQRATRIRIDGVCMALAKLYDAGKLDRIALRQRVYKAL